MIDGKKIYKLTKKEKARLVKLVKYSIKKYKKTYKLLEEYDKSNLTFYR